MSDQATNLRVGATLLRQAALVIREGRVDDLPEDLEAQANELDEMARHTQSLKDPPELPSAEIFRMSDYQKVDVPIRG